LIKFVFKFVSDPKIKAHGEFKLKTLGATHFKISLAPSN